MPTATEMRDELLEKGDKLRELRTTHPDRRSDTWEADMRTVTREIGALDHEFEVQRHLEEFDVEARAWEQAVEFAKQHPGSESRGPQAAFSQSRDIERVKSAGERAVEEWFDGGNPSVNLKQSPEIELRGREQAEFRNLLTGGQSGPGSDLFVPVGTPFLAPQGVRRRRLFARDLLTVQPTNLNSVPYIRELNPATNELGSVSAVAEASAKTEVTMQFQRADAPVRKLAAWVQITDEALADATTLRGYIDGRLGYMLDLSEEIQILVGDGSGVNLTGISNTTNVQTQAQTGDFYKSIGLGISKVEQADGYPDGVACHPADYWAAITTRNANQFDGGFGVGAPFSAPPPMVWGLPVVRSRSMPAFQAIVGAWALGATLFEREGNVIRSTDSHASLFTSNIVVILAEERVGLAVHRPDFFCKVTVP